MRVLCFLLFLVGCTSTRQLARPADPRLRAPIGGDGIVVATTEPWKMRVDPFTTLRVRSSDGAWSQPIESKVARVDEQGVWLDGGNPVLAQYADEIELSRAPSELLAILEATRTADAALSVDGDVATLRADPSVMQIWLVAIEDAIEKRGIALEHEIRGRRTGDRRDLPRGEAAAVFDISPASICIHTPQLGWGRPLENYRLRTALHARTPARVGWPWSQVAAVEVENMSGGKTLGAIFGIAAAAVVIAPVALLARGVPLAQGRAPSGGRALTNTADALGRIGTGGRTDPGRWQPEPAPEASLRARRMFSDGAIARALLRGTLALDGFAAKTGDLAGSGLVAKLRIRDAFEIGGGVRVVASKDERGWRRSVTHVFAMGTHLPLDAAQRFAIPIGFEASGGGSIAHDVRLPWGFRYSPRGTRWFGTIQPATPAWMRTTSEKTGRWTLNGSVEVGATF